MLLRAAYALALLLIVSAFRLGWGNPFGIGGHLADVVQNITAWQTVIWVVYVSGYSLAALFVLQASRRALWAYGVAVTLDFSVWIYAAFSPSYNMIWSGQASVVDIIFNVYDLGVLLCLMILVRQRVLR